MTDSNLNLELNRSQISDLVNALEDHRDDFKRKAVEAQNGFGLDSAYWESRATDIEATLQIVVDASRANIAR